MKRLFSVLFVSILVAASLFEVAAQTVAENDSSAAYALKTKSLPLITTRTLKFTTDEGTWISLDVSPDGSQIIFELLGDLYTIPIEGGNATRITSGQAYDMQPRYSPDGSKIVFISDRNGAENVWLADADGKNAHALSKIQWKNFVSPTWTPDGQYIVVSRNTELVLYHVDVVGGSGIEITGKTGTKTGSYYGSAFGPDPDYIWINVTGTPSSGFGLSPVGDELDPNSEFGHSPRSSPREVGAYQIAQFERKSGRVLVRSHEHTGAFRPVPSPDGKWVVYATRFDGREALKLLDVETGDLTWLKMDVQRDASQGGGTNDRDVYPGSAFTPDSKALITAYGGKIMRVEVPSGEATEIPFTAEVEQELGPLAKFDYPINDSLLTISQIRGARPSPDRSSLVFTTLNRLWIADLEAGSDDTAPTDSTHAVLRNARRLTSETVVEHAPVWSPDGIWISYVTWSDETGGDIYRMRADGRGAPQKLSVQSAFFDRLAYSKDGSRLLAVRGSNNHRTRTLEDFGTHHGSAELEYVWLPADGGAHTRIIWVGSGATQQGRNAPHIGPDPDRVYIWSGSEGLLSMRFDGTDVRTLLKVKGPAHPRSTTGGGTPSEVVLSPDGKRALVQVNRNVYLITVPPVGGDAVSVSVTSSSVVPNRRLTKVGGDFVGWSVDGKTAHYSIGRSYFEWDVQKADSLFRADAIKKRLEAEAKSIADALSDSTKVTPADSSAIAPADSSLAVAVDSSLVIPADSSMAVASDSTSKKEDEKPVYESTRRDMEIVVAKDRPEGLIALTGARLITMKEDEIIESGDILIRNNRIEAIGPSGTISIPADATTFDMTGKTIYPGLVDIHAHAWFAWGVHRTQISQYLAALAYGITTQRDPQTSAEDQVSYTDLMETGEFIGPRSYSTGPGVFSADNIKSLKEARDVLKRYSEYFNTQTIKQYMAGDRKIRQWIIMAANELGLTPTTEGGSNFTMNLTLMQDGYAGLEHSLPISPFYKDVVDLLTFSGLTYTPTLIVAYGGPSGINYYVTHTNLDEVERLKRFTPHDELDQWKRMTYYRDDQYVHPLHAEQLKKVVEAGGRVGLGSHGEVQGIGAHWELWMLASGGMDPHDALRAATIHGADAIGLDNDLGSLEVGKLADLQVLDSNPLDDIKNSIDISYVMKNGRLYEADTLNEIWPRQKELPEQWWWRFEPNE